jgi:outer membrane protein
MRVRWLAALAVPFAIHAQGVASGDARPLSLDEAIRLAQRSAPGTVSARSQIRTSDAAVRTAYGTYIPTFSSNYSGSKQIGDAVVDGRGFERPSYSYSFGFSSNLELFDGMRRANQLRSAKANLAAAESNERLQRFRVALEVKQQFFIVAAARESRTAALAQLAQAEEQLKVASARVAARVAILSDSLRSVIQVGNAQLAVLNAENSLRNANATLTRLVATPYLVTAAVSENEGLNLVTLDSAQIAGWLNDAPLVSQARSEVNAAGASLRQSRSPYWPTLNMNMNLSGNGTGTAFSLGASNYSKPASTIRIALSYPIFNGFGREENVARAAANETNAVAQLRDAQFQAEQQLTQYVGALRLAEARATIQQASVTAAEEDLRVQSQRYALGSSTLLDVLTSQTTLNQARASLIQARYDARLAKAQIEALIGRDLP